MSRMNRRDFLRTATLATGAAAVGPSFSAMGANDEIRVFICGVRGQGFSNAKALEALKGVSVIGFCDVDSKVLEVRRKNFADEFDGKKIDGAGDYRKVLERDDVDAILIATPNHWHSLMAIHACQAGKDVYVQKPISHTIWEGRQLLNASEKYGRIVQTGTQNRSDIGLRRFYEYLQEGNLGKVTSVRGLCHRKRSSIGKLDKPLTPPETVDYNLWLGPAADIPIYRPQFHYDWHWEWNCGNGDVGNQGPHETDLLRWAIGEDCVPSRVVSFGGRFGWDDAGNTPNIMYAAYECAGIPMIFEVRDLALKPDGKDGAKYEGVGTGVIITCEGGVFRGGRGGGAVYDKNGKKIKSFRGDGGRMHETNFIEAMRSRKVSDLHAPAKQGHLSATVAHQANISFRIGEQVTPEELRERMSEDKEAMDAIARYSEHLADWDIDLGKNPWTMGVSLSYDTKEEKFTGDHSLVAKANEMLHRKDREPFVVPKI